MTAQIPDEVLYKSRKYEIAGIAGSGLFDPADLGIKPDMMHTACYRGYYCTYKVRGGQLYLDQLTLRTEDMTYPDIAGVSPEQGEEWFCVVYRGLGIPTPFTGKLRLATDFIRELYVHMGYQKPTSYSTVIDVTFSNGLVTGERDRSAEVAALRARAIEEHGRMDAIRYIDYAFSLDIEPEEPPEEP